MKNELLNDLQKLSSLEDDWYGDPSVVPTNENAIEMITAVNFLPLFTRQYIIEIDDNEISVCWCLTDYSASFALHTQSTGNVVITLSTFKSPLNEQCWKLPINDIRLFSRFRHKDILQIIC